MVIAIIAILASLLFPVFGRVREGVRQGNCMTNLHEIGVDVKPVLYRYMVSTRQSSCVIHTGTNCCAAARTSRTGVLYPDAALDPPLNAQTVLSRPFAPSSGQRHNMDVGIFQCPDNVKNNNRSAGVFMALCLQEGRRLAALPPAAAAKFDGGHQSDFVVYYNFDSYDTGPQLDMNGIPVVPAVQEIHYALDWTGAQNYAVSSDAQNQLKYPASA